MNECPVYMIDVMHCTAITPGARVLWWELRTQWTGGSVNECFPPQHKLAEILGTSRSSITRWSQELADVGLLKIVRQQRGNMYVLVDETSGTLAPPA